MGHLEQEGSCCVLWLELRVGVQQCSSEMFFANLYLCDLTFLSFSSLSLLYQMSARQEL